jgi:hypothetical protein
MCVRESHRKKNGNKAEKKFEMIETLKSLKSFLHEIKAGL